MSAHPFGPGTEPDHVRHQFAAALMAQREICTPLFDQADGIRADMAQRGWSPAAAEQIALTWLLGSITAMFTTLQQGAS